MVATSRNEVEQRDSRWWAERTQINGSGPPGRPRTTAWPMDDPLRAFLQLSGRVIEEAGRDRGYSPLADEARSMADDQFTDEQSKALWERILSTPSEVAFREFVLDQLSLQADDRVLSVGCGPGFETEALAEYVGEAGQITGIDVNERVLAAAEERCDDLPQVSHAHGDATDLPVADDAYDLAIAKQVLMALDDVEAALSELRRVLVPGGRLAVTAGDSRSHVMNESTERMRRANEIYRSEIGEQRLGTRMHSMLPDAGFAVEALVPRAKHSTTITDQIERGIDVHRGLLEGSDAFDDAEIERWEQDLRDLDEAGQYLSASIAFLYVARKPE